MLKYFILFSIIGAAINYWVKDDKHAIGIMILVAIFWGLSSKIIWGFVTLGELMLGYIMCKLIIQNKTKD